MNTADIERITFFQTTLSDLRKAASDGYEALQVSCQKTYTAIQKLYPEVPALCDTSELQCVSKDEFSQSLLPEDCKHLTTLSCHGDGNCLYRLVYCLVHMLPEVLCYATV